MCVYCVCVLSITPAHIYLPNDVNLCAVKGAVWVIEMAARDRILISESFWPNTTALLSNNFDSPISTDQYISTMYTIDLIMLIGSLNSHVTNVYNLAKLYVCHAIPTHTPVMKLSLCETVGRVSRT